jgi:hypothetical protein
MYARTLPGSFPYDPLTNPWVKVLDFGVFLRFRERGVLSGNPSIPLDLASFGGQIIAMECP